MNLHKKQMMVIILILLALLTSAYALIAPTTPLTPLKQWQDYKIIVNETVSIPAGQYLALDEIWNKAGAFTPTEPGKYHVYASFTTSDGYMIEDTYEFEVKGEPILPCTDSDGKDIFTKGFVISSRRPDSPYEDYCAIQKESERRERDDEPRIIYEKVDKCSGNNCFVHEFLCEGDELSYERIPCLAGCRDGACIPLKNTRNVSQYSEKEAFLISDKNWHDILPSVSVTTWTENETVHKHPTLIFHEETYSNKTIELDKAQFIKNTGLYVSWNFKDNIFAKGKVDNFDEFTILFNLSDDMYNKMMKGIPRGDLNLTVSKIDPQGSDYDIQYEDIFLNGIKLDYTYIMAQDGRYWIQGVFWGNERDLLRRGTNKLTLKRTGGNLLITGYTLFTPYFTSDEINDRCVFQEEEHKVYDLCIEDAKLNKQSVSPGETISYSITVKNICDEVIDLSGEETVFGGVWYNTSALGELYKSPYEFAFTYVKTSIPKVKLNPDQSVQFDIVLVYDKSEDIPEHSFDADSIIYFMQQYKPSRLTIIGDTPQELDTILVAEPLLGAGLSEEKIQRIRTEEYLSYWEYYKDVVYVEDDYELALLASTYASLINAPLLINGYNDNVDLSGRNIICVGNPAAECNEKYSLEELQQKYMESTNTDMFILVNPDDLNIKNAWALTPDKSANKVIELYSEDSLASPILASAKHELILPVKSTDYQEIDNFFMSKLNEYDDIPRYESKTCKAGDACSSGFEEKTKELRIAKNSITYKFIPDPFADLIGHKPWTEATVNVTTDLHIIVINKGLQDAENVTIKLFKEGVLINSTNLSKINRLDAVVLSIPWTPTELGYYSFRLEISASNDPYLDNNVVYGGARVVDYVVERQEESFGRVSLALRFKGILFDCSEDIETIELYNNGKLIGTTTEWCFDAQHNFFYFSTIYFDNIDNIEPGELELRFNGVLSVGIDSIFDIDIILGRGGYGIFSCDSFRQACAPATETLIIRGTFSNKTTYFNFDDIDLRNDYYVSVDIAGKDIINASVFVNNNFMGYFNYVGENKQKKTFKIPKDVIKDSLQIKIEPHIYEGASEPLYYADVTLEPTITLPYFLTIISGPEAIPMSRVAAKEDGCGWAYKVEADGRIYGSLNNYELINLPVGRIMGLTVSDTSGYIARDLFFDELPKNKDALLVVREDWQHEIFTEIGPELDVYQESWANEQVLEEYARRYFWTDEVRKQFDNEYLYSGHDEVSNKYDEIHEQYDEVYLNSFNDHGGHGEFHGMMDSSYMIANKMYLKPSLVIGLACSTCMYRGWEDLFCIQGIRRGAMAQQGAVDISYWHQQHDNILKGTILEGKTIGEAYMEARNEDYEINHANFCENIRGDPFYALLGDPTWKPRYW